MKKYVAAAEQVDLRSMSNKDFLKYVCAGLKSRGIDTTLHKYEMKAEAYERYGGGETYVVDFKCPGDYLAYVAMSLAGHRAVRTLGGLADAVSDIADDFIDVDNNRIDFDAFLEEYGRTVAGMEDFASENWWGDGDDYIIYLKNLDTGKTLYKGDDPEPEIYDEDEEDWDNWED